MAREGRGPMLATRAVSGLGFAIMVMIATLLSAGAAELADQQVLRIGNGSEPQTLDTALSENIQDGHIENDLFEGLIILDAAAQVIPGVAESWTLSPDGLVYTFKLRADAKWSNGDPVTAEDFAWSWRRVVNPATGSKYAFLYYPIKNAEDIATARNPDVNALGVKAVDPQTFQVTLKSPTGYFLSALSHPIFGPQHRATIETFGNQFTRAGNLVSNGAFTLKEWTPQSRIVLVRNPHYWDVANVKLTEVSYYPIENQHEELKRYRAGELDITNDVPSDQVDFIKQNFPKELRLHPYFGSYYLSLNVTKPPFKDNLKLRQAVNMVIDRDAITSRITRTGELPAYGWVPPGIPGYTPQTVPWKDMPMAERIAAAKVLYQEAGYGPSNPLKLQIHYNTSENHKKIMIAVAAMLKQTLGIESTLINEEFKVFLETRKQKKVTQLFRSGWVGDYADPNSFAEFMQSESGLNDSGYSNPAYDKLVKQAAVTVDPEKRADLLEQAERLLLADLPIMPIYYNVNKRVVKPTVVGFEPNILGYFYSKNISITKQ
jgi:oligopeptide transport system substrate-binding protein